MSLSRNTKVKVLKAANVYEKSRAVGEAFLADDNTAANLVRKGILEIVSEDKPTEVKPTEEKPTKTKK